MEVHNNTSKKPPLSQVTQFLPYHAVPIDTVGVFFVNYNKNKQKEKK